MDRVSINLSSAKKIIHDSIAQAEKSDLEQFWLFQLSKLFSDSKLLDRIESVFNDREKHSQSVIDSCYDHILKLSKRHWRELFNNNIIELYENYLILKIYRTEVQNIQEISNVSNLETVIA